MRVVFVISILIAALAACLAQTPASAPVPMPMNGAFETGIDGWFVQALDNAVGGKPIRLPDALSWEKTDTGLDPKTKKPSVGALKVTLKDLPPNVIGHQTGALSLLGANIKAADNDVLVTFQAKLLSGDGCLQINRTWGGGSSEPITLTKEWKEYKIAIQIGFDSPELLFSFVEPNSDNYFPRKVVPGSFLLDNIVVTAIPKLKEDPTNLLRYGSFEQGPYLWNVRLYTDKERKLVLAQDQLAAETKDLPKSVANNTGAMKVTLKNIPAGALCHNTGASVHLLKPVKSADSMIKVTFYAKLLTPEKANLQISRISGGSNALPVALTHEWALYEVLVPLAYDTPSLCFALVSPADTNDKLHAVIEGEFLIDQVVVTAVPKPQ